MWPSYRFTRTAHLYLQRLKAAANRKSDSFFLRQTKAADILLYFLLQELKNFGFLFNKKPTENQQCRVFAGKINVIIFNKVSFIIHMNVLCSTYIHIVYV